MTGTSHCHVRISDRPIASPLISRPNVMVAMNEPSLRKFLPAMETGGLILYNGAACPEDCRRDGVRVMAAPFTEYADALGGAKATNMVMLGALVESGHLPFDSEVTEVLRKRVRNQRWLEIDFAALARGREAARNQPEVHDEGVHTR